MTSRERDDPTPVEVPGERHRDDLEVRRLAERVSRLERDVARLRAEVEGLVPRLDKVSRAMRTLRRLMAQFKDETNE